jgi:hypothetical protein
MLLRNQPLLLAAAPAALSSAGRVEAAPRIDCNCVTNPPRPAVLGPGAAPGLRARTAYCFGTDMMPGSGTQSFPPGMQLDAGTWASNRAQLTYQYDGRRK